MGVVRMPGNMQLDRRLTWLLRAALAVLLFGLLFRVIGWHDFLHALSQTEWRWLAPLYLTAALAIAVNATMLRFVLRCTGLIVRLRRVLLAKALGSFYALILPGDMFAGAAKWADLSAATGDRAGVLSAMVLAKIALAVPPLLLGSVALLIDNPLPDHSLVTAAIATAIVVFSATAFALSPLTGAHFTAAMNNILARAPGLIRKAGLRLMQSLAIFQTLALAAYFRILGLSLLVFGLAILGMLFATHAAGVSVPLTVLIWINLILFITRMLPVTVGNLGVRESILAVIFGLYGIPPAAAVLVGLLMFSSMLFVGSIGGAYQLAIVNGWVQWRTGARSR